MDNEQKLLTLFRQLNESGQAKILELADLFASSEDFRKSEEA